MKVVSDRLFTFRGTASPAPIYERCSATDLGLKESWFRDAIFQHPELVIGPCRAAGLTDDDWFPWQKEFSTDVGPLDVLLVSSEGRVAIVETKLASRPEIRRKVLAQALDYLTHLPTVFERAMPKLPEEDGRPVADEDDVREAVSQGDILVIIAGDEVDSRVARLSRTLLAEHLVKQWDLVLIDLALYRLSDGAGAHLIVPHIRNAVESEPRQVVRVIVEGENPRARVEVERVEVDPVTGGRRRWTEASFFAALDGGDAPAAVQKLAGDLRDMAATFDDSVAIAWGSGKVVGSMVFKRNDGGLIEIFASGELRFRPNKFARALGEDRGEVYRRAIAAVVPGGVGDSGNPGVSPVDAARIAPQVFDAIKSALEGVGDIP